MRACVLYNDNLDSVVYSTNPFLNMTLIFCYQIIFTCCLIAVVVTDSISDRNAETKFFKKDVNPDGSYSWQYETDNEIRAQEAGAGGVIAQGGASWYAPEGDAISFTYTADHNGYRPEGKHLPTAPPTPPLILRALEYLRQHATERPDEHL